MVVIRPATPVYAVALAVWSRSSLPSNRLEGPLDSLAAPVFSLPSGRSNPIFAKRHPIWSDIGSMGAGPLFGPLAPRLAAALGDIWM